MTARQIDRELGRPVGTTSKNLRLLMVPTVLPRAPKRVYIHSWTQDEEGCRSYLRAVYAAGSKKDAEKPARLTNAQLKVAIRKRTSNRDRAASIFTLAARCKALANESAIKE
jgi:hypothetical protein